MQNFKRERDSIKNNMKFLQHKLKEKEASVQVLNTTLDATNNELERKKHVINRLCNDKQRITHESRCIKRNAKVELEAMRSIQEKAEKLRV